MGFLLSWFSGVKFYVLVAVVLAFLGLAGYGAYEHQSALAAKARVETVTHERDDLSVKLVQAETDKAELVARAQEVDGIVVAQHERERKLEDEKALLWKQFDALAKVQPKADQDCLTRPLPPAVLEWLRDGPDSPNPLPTGANPGKPAA